MHRWRTAPVGRLSRNLPLSIFSFCLDVSDTVRCCVGRPHQHAGYRVSGSRVRGLPDGVKTLRTQDTSDPRHFGTGAEVSVRHFGTSAELSGHIGTSAEVSYGHFGTKENTSALSDTGQPMARWTAVLA